MGLRRLALALGAVRQVGFQPLALYACYQLGLRTGYYRWATPASTSQTSADGGPLTTKSGPFPASRGRLSAVELILPSRAALAAALGERAAELRTEAEEIVAGKVRLFGAEPVPLVLATPDPLRHWTAYEMGSEGKKFSHPEGEIPPENSGDIKFTWEPGRFGWAYILGRAYRFSGDERYAQAFWGCAETFLEANPPNLGPHWSSAQEVALRLIALVFAAQVFAGSVHTTRERDRRLMRAVGEHAARIPPTLVYARYQNNNHLLVEAAGLVTAGLFLAGCPAAAGWRELGWRWFQRGLASQIAMDGAYTQNSVNYHRLMLQIALWVTQVAQGQGQAFPEISLQRLAAAARWLLALVDPQTGQVPNLGPNDGAYIFPLAACPFADYRPVLQAACQAFLGERPFPPGPWDEMALWIGRGGEGERGSRGAGEDGRASHLPSSQAPPLPSSPPPLLKTPHVLRSPSGQSWAYFRIARHTARPGHADQLHLDLWWRGWNVAQDAGTYLYNAWPPWENALASTFVHNTVTIDGQEQMKRAGRFLWLEWAQGQALSGQGSEDGAWQLLLAQQDGYRGLGILHQRQVSVFAPDRWMVEDRLSTQKPSAPDAQHAFRLHWLLPDWRWEVGESGESRIEVRLESPGGWISLGIRIDNHTAMPGSEFPILPLALQVVRAGELLDGPGPISPTWGWVSPTYGQKNPALSFAVIAKGSLQLSIVSEWIFPDASSPGK